MAALPHVTWCATGPFSFLPLHAAGIYNPASSGQQQNVFDYAISSYTPNISALLEASKAPPPMGQSEAHLLVASQSGENLVNVSCEIESIRSLVERVDWLEGTAATREAVMRGMKANRWIHLACHRMQSVDDPLQSAFLLHDGPLTLVDIMKQSHAHTELAVLLACQTATGDEELSDEAVHLATGMLMAGYNSVVATLWSILDEDAPLIAEKFYSDMMKHADGDPTRSAYALHYAVQCLRDSLCDTDGFEDALIRWLPYIHMGV